MLATPLLWLWSWELFILTPFLHQVSSIKPRWLHFLDLPDPYPFHSPIPTALFVSHLTQDIVTTWRAVVMQPSLVLPDWSLGISQAGAFCAVFALLISAWNAPLFQDHLWTNLTLCAGQLPVIQLWALKLLSQKGSAWSPMLLLLWLFLT